MGVVDLAQNRNEIQGIVSNMVMGTTLAIYAQLLLGCDQGGIELGVDKIREIAKYSKDLGQKAAPFLAEAFGMIKIDIKPVPVSAEVVDDAKKNIELA